MRLPQSFYARSVHEVARGLVGCTVRHGSTAGRIVETESYHMDEPACHAHVGLTGRTHTLFGEPGRAYVYFSYGIHALLNAVAEPEGTGAAVLIRALEPLTGLDLMRARRGLDRAEDLCSGPGKLTQALGLGLELNGSSLTDGPIEVLAREHEPRIVSGEQIGITKAADLPWRFCDADSAHVSRPWPAGMRRAA
jgi:DNA-3-methyladenine glycosylase